MLTASISLQLGVPGAVAVRHAVDGERRVLVRTVGDLTGVLERAEIQAAFGRCLLTDAELVGRGRVWEEAWDGLEPWLGPIGRVA